MEPVIDSRLDAAVSTASLATKHLDAAVVCGCITEPGAIHAANFVKGPHDAKITMLADVIRAIADNGPYSFDEVMDAVREFYVQHAPTARTMTYADNK